MKNTGNSGLRVGIYYVSFLLRFLQIDKNILYLLAAQKNHFLFEMFVRKPLENKATLPCLQN